VRQENGYLELPAQRLRAGENIVLAEFTANIAPAGKSITRYEDRNDRSEYLHTLFVPMDSSMAFPCFDQLDLRARFRLELTTPNGWTVISNATIESSAPTEADTKRTAFGETPPLSTYQLAFGAGPFRRLPGGAGVWSQNKQQLVANTGNPVRRVPGPDRGAHLAGRWQKQKR
jgi:aminopeptidase N